jgi:hypothetical protein
VVAIIAFRLLSRIGAGGGPVIRKKVAVETIASGVIEGAAVCDDGGAVRRDDLTIGRVAEQVAAPVAAFLARIFPVLCNYTIGGVVTFLSGIQMVVPAGLVVVVPVVFLERGAGVAAGRAQAEHDRQEDKMNPHGKTLGSRKVAIIYGVSRDKTS